MGGEVADSVPVLFRKGDKYVRKSLCFPGRKVPLLGGPNLSLKARADKRSEGSGRCLGDDVWPVSRWAVSAFQVETVDDVEKNVAQERLCSGE